MFLGGQIKHEKKNCQIYKGRQTLLITTPSLGQTRHVLADFREMRHEIDKLFINQSKNVG